jgi:hypothetical protein
MTKAADQAENAQREYRRQRRLRLEAEARRNQAERAAEQVAACAGPPPWLTVIPRAGPNER